MKLFLQLIIVFLFFSQSFKANDKNSFANDNPFSENIFDEQSTVSTLPPPPPPDDGGGGGTTGTGETVGIDMFVLILFFIAILIIIFHKQSLIMINVAKKTN